VAKSKSVSLNDQQAHSDKEILTPLVKEFKMIVSVSIVSTFPFFYLPSLPVLIPDVKKIFGSFLFFAKTRLFPWRGLQ
jgi:hypothetical protein